MAEAPACSGREAPACSGTVWKTAVFSTPEHVVAEAPEHVVAQSGKRVVAEAPEHVVAQSGKRVVAEAPEHVVAESGACSGTERKTAVFKPFTWRIEINRRKLAGRGYSYHWLWRLTLDDGKTRRSRYGGNLTSLPDGERLAQYKHNSRRHAKRNKGNEQAAVRR
jgi:hypothetical protein